MIGPCKRITNRLGFRIVLPVVLVTLFLGVSLYLFVLRSISHFTERQIQETFRDTANDIYGICDRSLKELLTTGASANEEAARIKKGLTLERIEDFMKQFGIDGAVFEGEREILSAGSLPQGLAQSAGRSGGGREVKLIHLGEEEYYSYHFEFEPWQWRIVLIHRPTEYASLLSRLKIAYGVTGVILLASAFLLLYYFNTTMGRPIGRIISCLGKGEKPDYKGIAEFEYLSDSLHESMDMRERENSILNNIYCIAISRRGEEFFSEVVMAIRRIFDLNSLIAKVTPDTERAEVSAMYLNGKLTGGMHISLAGTPCEGVVAKKHMVVIERNACREFPHAELLTDTQSESYIGLAIFNRKGEVAGIVNAFGKQREFSESDIKVFQTIGQMVATEFEMLDKEKNEERMRGELFQAQKLEAVGTLAGGIAHDFNNMLQGILGYASLLKMKVPDTDPIYRPLSVIESSAEKAAELTKQLLGFARKGKYIVEPLNLNAIVEEVYKIITRTFDKAIEITTRLKHNLWTIDGDRSQIEHVLLNLCLNARDAMPSGGGLHIETSNVDLRPEEIREPWLRPGRYAVIKVVDTGTGMTDEVKKHIFEPFFTTKEKGKGTGMGLAMVYGVVKNHDGFISVETGLGKGASFTIYLPAVEKEVMKEEVEEKSLPRGKGTVLVADDEEFVRIFVRETLEKLGYEVREASDGLEATEIYSAGNKEIDLVILDLVMPKMGGEEAFKNLKAIDPDVKVLISTGYGIGEQTKEMMKDTGIRGFLQKPYTVAELAELTRSALASA